MPSTISTPIMENVEPAEAEDWTLAQLARDGNEDAFATLVARHQGRIQSFIHRSAGDEQTARDLTQEVFVKAWFALDRFRPKARFSTWLFQIALNLCRDLAKSRVTRMAKLTSSLTWTSSESQESDREFSDPNPPPDDRAEISELVAALDSEIRRLPHKLRQPFLLGAVERHPYKEVGEILGISAKAVEIRIYRARQILCERLARAGIISQ